MYVETVIGIVGIGVGAFTTYTLIKLKEVQRQLDVLKEVYEDFPTPEEMAKKVLSTKLPVSELPKDIQQDIMNTARKFYQNDQNQPSQKREVLSPEYVG